MVYIPHYEDCFHIQLSVITNANLRYLYKITYRSASNSYIASKHATIQEFIKSLPKETNRIKKIEYIGMVEISNN